MKYTVSYSQCSRLCRVFPIKFKTTGVQSRRCKSPLNPHRIIISRGERYAALNWVEAMQPPIVDQSIGSVESSDGRPANPKVSSIVIKQREGLDVGRGSIPITQ